MSHGSELNQPSETPSEKPEAKRPVEFLEFEASVAKILKKYAIENFHIKCSLTLSWLYLNTKYKEEEGLADIETEPTVSLTEDQQKIPFIQALFSILKQFNISSFHVDTWSPNNYGGHDHVNVVGGKDFDYSHLLMQDDESTLAGSSSSALDPNAP